ncbi:MAG: PTS sugar transporter subunit IIA [Alphaproteobacteria bacterium]|nr:PTS sugar transporter subunit IIA [Alphaproteobacteria bacterium]MCB9985842.1 PTS sugar transporter subunit IIA [Micavibrio sp.]HPQ50267.1 PTS sugar transporter subunit IIA [Alphaproteobacteria bacterium]HRK97525.1 PTS sugar transporter subunit IIA [Alphaproteobacteria bacterium]
MPMEDDLNISSVQYGLKGSNPEQIIKNLSWKISLEIKASASCIHAEIQKAEQHHRSGIGDGVAILDWMSPSVKTPYVLISRLEDPLDINALDDRPIDILLILMSPESQSMTHLRHVARLTRMLRNEKILKKLRATQSANDMRAIFISEHEKLLVA